MSIAITAQQKLDFQDIVCVALILRHMDIPDARFLAEPKDGEDGELQFDQQGRSVVVEVQVKGASGAITLADIATYLAHTPPRTEHNTLLERLINDPNRLAVLVASGRCDDAASTYAVSMEWLASSENRRTVSVTQTQALLDAFAVAALPSDPDSPLTQARQVHNSDLARRSDRQAVREALSRLVILERLQEADLEAFCAEYLRRVYRVPGDRLDDVIGRCRAAVKTVKGQAVDVFPLIRAELERAMPQSIRPLDYVDRGNEQDLASALSNDGVLLLSGRTRVGKTWAARTIASTFEPLGYEVREFQDIDQAERFLLEPSDAARLALLDDPLGGIHSVPAPTRVLSRLRALVTQLRPNRKLIVAQEVNRLLSVSGAVSVADVVTATSWWRDLNSLPSEFLSGLWLSLAERFRVPPELRAKVLSALQSGALTLEPGCLEYLAVNHSQVQASADLEQIERIARLDATDLSRALASEPSEPLLAALAISTTPSEPIDRTTIAYVSGAGGPGLPGKDVSVARIVSFGAPLKPKPAPPSYDEPPALTGDQLTWLDDLEQRRLLTASPDKCYNLGHPYYRAAAEKLLHAPTSLRAERSNTTVERGLFCLSPQTSHATARNLKWVFDALETRPEAQSALLDTAAQGLKSFFPATRDLCFRFLLQHVDAMSTDQQRELPDWVSRVTFFALPDLEWTDGQAHLPYGDTSGLDYAERVFLSVGREEVASELALLDDPAGPFVSGERAARVLQYMAHHPDELTSNAMGRLLSYDEAAIRAEAIRLWLTHARSDDEQVLVRIFEDDHPICALRSLQGAVAGWVEYDTVRQAAILQGLVSLAGNPACAAAMLDWLVLFDRVEETGETPPWPLFGAVIPIVMGALPQNANFIDARLFGVAKMAVKELPPAPIMALCDSWINWLDLNVSEGVLPSEFDLGVVDIMMTTTIDDPDIRNGRVDRLLAFPGTGALVAFVADLVDHWDWLTPHEQTAVLDRLRTGSEDDHWLQAVALTRRSTPADIERALLGDSVRLSDGPDALLTHMAPDLLLAAVHVYSGSPQPLWWLGTHHVGKAVWEPVVERIAHTPTHPLFELAWNHIAYGDGGGGRIATAIRHVGFTEADLMLDILLRIKVAWVGNFMPEAWAALLSLASDEAQHGLWIDRMAKPVAAILDDLSDLSFWLSEDRDSKAMADRLKSDFLLLQMIKEIADISKGISPSEIPADLFNNLTLIIDKLPPTLFGTCGQLVHYLKDQGAEAEPLRQALKKRREDILNGREKMKEDMERPDPPLKGWVTP